MRTLICLETIVELIFLLNSFLFSDVKVEREKKASLCVHQLFDVLFTSNSSTLNLHKYII